MSHFYKFLDPLHETLKPPFYHFKITQASRSKFLKKYCVGGVVIFLLTFNLIIIVASYCVDNVLNMARDNISTICTGVGLCQGPGEDLHKFNVVDVVLLDLI